MIAFLKGILASKTEDAAVIDVGGVGFMAYISLTTYRELPRVGEEVTLHTALILREDDIKLFGFYSEDERELFQALITINGIGAKMAVDILSHLTLHHLAEAVQRNETALLTQVPGIGKKRAERLLLDLRHMKNGILLAPITQLSKTNGPALKLEGGVQEAIEALQALGLKPLDAHRAVAAAAAHLGDNAPVSELIKEGLKRR